MGSPLDGQVYRALLTILEKLTFAVCTSSLPTRLQPHPPSPTSFYRVYCCQKCLSLIHCFLTLWNMLPIKRLLKLYFQIVFNDPKLPAAKTQGIF